MKGCMGPKTNTKFRKVVTSGWKKVLVIGEQHTGAVLFLS